MDYGKKITIESYDNHKLTSTKTHYEIPVPTSQMDILKDFIDALKPLTSGECKRIELEIRINEKGNWLLMKKY